MVHSATRRHTRRGQTEGDAGPAVDAYVPLAYARLLMREGLLMTDASVTHPAQEPCTRAAAVQDGLATLRR
jgi:hypothetical protein